MSEKKYPKPDSPTNCLSDNAVIIEVKPNPKMAASSSSIGCNFFPLPIARGMAINAKG